MNEARQTVVSVLQRDGVRVAAAMTAGAIALWWVVVAGSYLMFWKRILPKRQPNLVMLLLLQHLDGR